jgi:hypothetical protein
MCYLAARLASMLKPKAPRPLGGSSNGRTTDSDSVYRGSNPRPPANIFPRKIRHLSPRRQRPFVSLRVATRCTAKRRGETKASRLPLRCIRPTFSSSSAMTRRALTAERHDFPIPTKGARALPPDRAEEAHHVMLFHLKRAHRRDRHLGGPIRCGCHRGSFRTFPSTGAPVSSL